MREGESVCLLGRTPNGWYRCVALREAEHRLEPIYAPSRSVISGLSEISADSGLPPSASEWRRVGVEGWGGGLEWRVGVEGGGLG